MFRIHPQPDIWYRYRDVQGLIRPFLHLPPGVTPPPCLAPLEAPADCHQILKSLGILCVNEHEAPLSACHLNSDSCSDISAGRNDESDTSLTIHSHSPRVLPPPEVGISQSTTPVNPSGLNIVTTSIQDTRAMDESAAAATELQSTHFLPSFRLLLM
jgi:hypothetical protein